MTLIDLVPRREPSEQMDAIPVLRRTFKESVYAWRDNGIAAYLDYRVNFRGDDPARIFAAPTVQEMQGWLLDSQRLVDQLLTPLMTVGGLQLRRAGEVVASVPIQGLNDPDQLARACIAAATKETT